MFALSNSVISVGLIAGGALSCALVAGHLTANPEVAVPLNAFGINRSPYGEVLAMGMQGPIDVYFHGGPEAGHDHEPGEACTEECDHDHDHDHDDDHATTQVPAVASGSGSISQRMTRFIAGLETAVTTRTNPKPPSAALQFYLRRQTENRLRFAYNLDPSHYGNFAGYYFFLTQPALGTRPELTPSAVKLAQDTILYCLNEADDPRPALTAAAAAENILEKLVDDYRTAPRKPPLSDLRKTLTLLDLCLTRHAELSARWDASGHWELLSELRRDEARDRLQFLNGIRAALAKIVAQFEQEAVPNHSPTKSPTP